MQYTSLQLCNTRSLSHLSKYSNHRIFFWFLTKSFAKGTNKKFNVTSCFQKTNWIVLFLHISVMLSALFPSSWQLTDCMTPFPIIFLNSKQQFKLSKQHYESLHWAKIRLQVEKVTDIYSYWSVPEVLLLAFWYQHSNRKAVFYYSYSHDSCTWEPKG